MADVTVFVDEAVRGKLPPVCVKDGTPTDDRLTMRCEVGGATRLGVAWLLVLLGPLGWLGLGVIALMRKPAEWLTVKLPFSWGAYQRYRVARRMMTIWFIVAFTAAVAAVALLAMHHSASRLAAAACGLLASMTFGAGIREWRIARKSSVRVELDASRRWVTLSGVHPFFVAVVETQEKDDHVDQPQGGR